MPRTRKEVENLEELVKSKKKKYVRTWKISKLLKPPKKVEKNPFPSIG